MDNLKMYETECVHLGDDFDTMYGVFSEFDFTRKIAKNFQKRFDKAREKLLDWISISGELDFDPNFEDKAPFATLNDINCDFYMACRAAIIKNVKKMGSDIRDDLKRIEKTVHILGTRSLYVGELVSGQQNPKFNAHRINSEIRIHKEVDHRARR